MASLLSSVSQEKFLQGDRSVWQLAGLDLEIGRISGLKDLGKAYVKFCLLSGKHILTYLA